MAYQPSAQRISIHNPVDMVISAAINFNGEVPDGDISVDSTTGRITWAAGTNQGLFDPLMMGHNGHVRVLRMQLFMAGQSTWTVSVLDPTATPGTYNTGTLASGTTETFIEKEYLTILSPGQRLKLVTTGAGTTLVKVLLTLADSRAVGIGSRGV